MTIDEIMASEILEGKYVFAANVIRQAMLGREYRYIAHVVKT